MCQSRLGFRDCNHIVEIVFVEIVLSIEVRPFVLTLGVRRFNICSLSQVEEK